MARIVNEEAHAAKRNAILDTAQYVIATKGYEQMAIADILHELHMSSGAFYHYFSSKPALLEAVIERMVTHREQLMAPIINNPATNAIDKLHLFFHTLNQWKLTHKSFIMAYLRVLYSDDNAIVRHKLYLARIQRLTPWLESIITQGVNEGVLTTTYPDQVARHVVSLLEDLGYATVELLLAEETSPNDVSQLERIITATTDTLERVLGAPTGCLQAAFQDHNLSHWLPLPAQQP